MSARVQAASPEAVERLHNAMNLHDLGASRLFRSRLPERAARSSKPRLRRSRAGREELVGALRGHTRLHAGCWPVRRGDTVWSEWHWTGTRRANDAPLDCEE